MKPFRYRLIVFLLGGILMSGMMGGCNKKAEHPVATIEVENYGTIRVELYPDVAPVTVSNFITLANSGFYDGLLFHRVVADFMIQGGDPDGNGTGGPGYAIQGEFESNGIRNDISHEPGVISMARSKSYNSAGSQFFICVSDCTYLDKQYAAFGKTIEELDVAIAISKTDTDAYDKPIQDVVIRSIRVDTKGVDYSDFEKIQ